VHGTAKGVSLGIKVQGGAIVEENAQTNKDMPDRMAMETCKVEAAWVHLFGEAVRI